MSDELWVEQDDEEHRDAVGVDEDWAHEHPSVLVLSKVVEWASRQVALCNKK